MSVIRATPNDEWVDLLVLITTLIHLGFHTTQIRMIYWIEEELLLPTEGLSKADEKNAKVGHSRLDCLVGDLSKREFRACFRVLNTILI